MSKSRPTAKKSPRQSKVNIQRGPGHHWKMLTSEQRSAIGQKAAETRRRNAAQRAPKGDASNALDSVQVLEELALGLVSCSVALKRSMVAAAAASLRGYLQGT